jgi:tetratricopeptide (TPR) repeat protein
VRAFIYHKKGQWELADAAFVKALRSASVFSITNIWYSRFLASVGLLDRALEQAKLARQLDPLSPVSNSRLAIAFLWVNDLENAGKYFTIANQLGMVSQVHFEAYALFLVRLGKMDDAQTLVQKLHVAANSNADVSWVAPVFAAVENQSDRGQATQLLAKAVAAGTVAPREQVVLWSVLDEPQKALEVARLLIGGGEAFEPDLLFISELQGMRAQPEFPALLDNIGLTPFWSKIGCSWVNDQVVCKH